MDTTLFPTKGNLIAAKNTLRLARQGYELLDKKRNILIREMMQQIDMAKSLQEKIGTTFAAAYQALQTANILMGISTVEQISHSVKEDDGFEIRFRSVMGVDIPLVQGRDMPLTPGFGMMRTHPSLDEAYLHFEEVKHLTRELAQVENSVYRLAYSIKKTQKRANALKNIMIPKYEALTAFITNALEEKEREEFTRLKVIKSFKES